jgi:hypothetical protein
MNLRYDRVTSKEEARCKMKVLSMYWNNEEENCSSITFKVNDINVAIWFKSYGVLQLFFQK